MSTFSDPTLAAWDYAVVKDLNAAGGLNEMIDAVNERLLVSGTRSMGRFAIGADTHDVGGFISTMQLYLETAAVKFFDHTTPLNTLSYSDIYDGSGFPTKKNFTTSRWFQVAASESGISALASGFRRVTAISGATVTWATGNWSESDIIGPWLWQDIMACTSALRAIAGHYGPDVFGSRMWGVDWAHGEGESDSSWETAGSQQEDGPTPWPSGYGLTPSGFGAGLWYVHYTPPDHREVYIVAALVSLPGFYIPVPSIQADVDFWIVPQTGIIDGTIGPEAVPDVFWDIFGQGYVQNKVTKWGSCFTGDYTPDGSGHISIRGDTALVNPVTVLPPTDDPPSQTNPDFPHTPSAGGRGFYVESGFPVLRFRFTRSN